MVERAPTGIPGLDRLIGGGFPKGTVNLVTGKTGTAKSIFSSQFIFEGASEYGEGGLLINSEGTKQSLMRQMGTFGWDFEALEEDNLVKILEVQPFEVKKIISNITESIESMNVERIVIDSVSMFEVFLEKHYKIRRFLFTLFQRLRDLGIVTLITAEIPEDETSRLSRFGSVEFMADSVIKLQYMDLADVKRSLMIRKMVMTDHASEIYPFQIGREGIQVLDIEE